MQETLEAQAETGISVLHQGPGSLLLLSSRLLVLKAGAQPRLLTAA